MTDNVVKTVYTLGHIHFHLTKSMKQFKLSPQALDLMWIGTKRLPLQPLGHQ